jgi:hypothetical protein
VANGEAHKRLAAAFGPTADCVAIDELMLLLEGRRGEQEQRRAAAHLAICAYCTAELELFSEFESPSVREDEKAHVNAIVTRLRKKSPAPRERWWQSMWKPGFLVPASIALTAALVAMVFVLPPRQALGPVVTSGQDVMRSQRVELIAPAGDVAQPPREIEWRPVASASHYQVRLFEVDNTALWETTVSQPRAPLPADVRGKILPLKTLLWQVTALDANGAVLADSGKQSFRLQPAMAP